MPHIWKTRWAPWPCATPPLPPWPPARLARGGREELRWTNQTNLYFRPWRGFSCALMATMIMATMMMARSGRKGSRWTNLYFRPLGMMIVMILGRTNRTNFYLIPWRWFSLRILLKFFQLTRVRPLPGLVGDSLTPVYVVDLIDVLLLWCLLVLKLVTWEVKFWWVW